MKRRQKSETSERVHKRLKVIGKSPAKKRRPVYADTVQKRHDRKLRRLYAPR